MPRKAIETTQGSDLGESVYCATDGDGRVPDQDARGVDLTLIRHCLRLTPTQRILANEEALALIASARPLPDAPR